MAKFDWKCPECGGEFEADFGKAKPYCPGCKSKAVEVRWKRAPGISTGVAKGVDKGMESALEGYGLTDLPKRVNQDPNFWQPQSFLSSLPQQGGLNVNAPVLTPEFKTPKPQTVVLGRHDNPE